MERGALSDFNTVVSLNPRDARAYVNRGKVKVKLRQYQSAVDDFSSALHLDPNDASAYEGRGTVYMDHMLETEKACADWKRACELGDCRRYNRAKRRGLCD